MPISKYYGGHGEEVMSERKKKYHGRAEEVFYATANKMKMPKSHMKMSKAQHEDVMRGYKRKP